MDDRLRADKPPQYFTNKRRPTRPPTLSGTGNKYRPKCGDAVRLGSKGSYGSFRMCMEKRARVWQVKLRDPSLTRLIAYPSALDKYRKHYANRRQHALPSPRHLRRPHNGVVCRLLLRATYSLQRTRRLTMHYQWGRLSTFFRFFVPRDLDL